MSLEESFIQAYQRLSTDEKEMLRRIIMEEMGENLAPSREYINPTPVAPPKVKCPNCGTFIRR